MASKMKTPKKMATLRDVPAILEFAQRHRKTIFLQGGTGIGKTQIIQQAADKMFPLKKLPKQTTNFIYILLSDKDPTDLTGVQIPTDYIDNTGKTQTHAVYARPSFIPKDPDWQGIVFMDELTNAPPPSQQTAYQGMLEHVLGDYKFNDKCVFVGAGNRECDNGATYELLTPLANRMIIVDIVPDLDCWLEDFAEKNNVHRSVLGYLKQNPKNLHLANEPDQEQSVCTPRSWVTASEILYDLENKIISVSMARLLLDGCLSSGISGELLEYYNRTVELPPAIDILSGKIKNLKLEEHQVDLIYVCLQGCFFLLKEHYNNNDLSDEKVVKETKNVFSFFINSFPNHADIITGAVCNLTGQKSGNSTSRNMFAENNRKSELLKEVIVEDSILSFIRLYLNEYYKLIEEANSGVK